MTSLELLTAPVSEPVSLSEAKNFLRVDYTHEDALITSLITAAREWAENYTRRAMPTQSWRLWLDEWPVAHEAWWHGTREGAISASQSTHVELPKAPLQSIAQVRTFAADDTATVFSASNYLVDTASAPGRLVLRDGQSWPQPGRNARGIAIDFTAGYSSVPSSLKAAMLQLVALWFGERGVVAGARSTPPLSLTHILDTYRVRS
ncbi:MAG: hypothetical protein EB121_03685 [Alphaproteobacteria bacterium]|nr:hypothetical protein [Alphaproteobacteria bacterium]NDG04435.1 hypothetical protein [Alphaproteobacteria bacterium]